MTARGRTLWLRRLGLGVAGLALVMLLGEVGLRLRNGGHDASDAALAIDTLVGRMTRAFGAQDAAVESDDRVLTFHALLAYDNARADRVADRYLTEFARGGERELNVFIYGGSVSAQVGHQAADEIVNALSNDPRAAGKRAHVYPMGRGGYKAPQTLMALQHDLSLGLAPDVVLLIDGFNDVAVANQNVHTQFHPILPGAPFWLPLVSAPMSSRAAMDAAAAIRREQAWVTRVDSVGDALGLSHSALGSLALRAAANGCYQRWATAVGVYGRRAAEAKNDTVCRGPTFDNDPQQALELCAQIWLENARSMRAVCESRGIRFVHVLQPTLHDAGAKVATENEVRVGGAVEAWLEAVRIGYPLLRERGEQLREQGHEFIDASRLFEAERGEIYTDACHFNDEGRRALARRCAAAILARDPPFGARWPR